MLVAAASPSGGLVAGQIALRRWASVDATVDYDIHFVFTRISYGSGLSRFGGGSWEHDYPMADRNFAEILDYITNMRVRMDGSNYSRSRRFPYFREPDHLCVGARLLEDTASEAENLRAHCSKAGSSSSTTSRATATGRT